MWEQDKKIYVQGWIAFQNNNNFMEETYWPSLTDTQPSNGVSRGQEPTFHRIIWGYVNPALAIKKDDYTIATSEGIPVSGVHDHAGIFSGAYSSVPETPDGLVFRHFKVGIPGTGGGAAIMNAGAYEGQFSDVAVEVRCLVPDGNSWSIVSVPAAEANWGYRTSRMMREGWVVLGATLQLRADSPAAIAARMEELRERRESKQPLEMPSAGSAFKRPEGHFAGALIQEAGCQGLRVGGAQVSEKHAGFVVNTGDATAADVLALIAEVQRRVHETTGVQLEPEVRLRQ